MIFIFPSFRRIRGTLGSIANLCKNIGMLTSYILAAFLTYDQIPFVLIVIPIVYMINFAVLPNTPAFWVKRGEYEVSWNVESLGQFEM